MRMTHRGRSGLGRWRIAAAAASAGGDAPWGEPRVASSGESWTLAILTRAGAARPALLLLALACYALGFQGTRGLWEPDEGRYTVVALEMERLGDYLVPHLNRDTIHLTKPPLIYWLMTASMQVLGHNEWGARLPNALAFIATVIVVAGIGRRLAPGAALPPALVYATSLLPVAAANVVSTDTVLTLWETLAVYAFAELEWGDAKRRERHRLLFWLALGLAFLTKGPPGLIALIPIAIFVTTTAGWRGLRRLVSLPSLVVFVAVGLSWYLAVVATLPGALGYLLGREVYDRMFTGELHRNAGWLGPFIAYGPVVLLGALPWVAELVAGARGALRWFTPRWWRERRAGERAAYFLSLWLAAPFVPFVLSRSRLPLYLLPLAVPTSLLLARVATPAAAGRRRAAIVAAWIAFIVLGRGALALAESSKDSRALARAIEAGAPTAPAEVVFVDTWARNGVALYLDAEVEQFDLQPKSGTAAAAAPAMGSQRSIADEFTEHEGPHVYVVSREDLDAFQQAVTVLGVTVERRGGWRNLSFFWPTR